MRTTLDIPDGLGKRVKMTAIRRGLSMKDLIITALQHELDTAKARTGAKGVRFPLVPTKKAAVYELKPEIISDILIREEVPAYDAPDVASITSGVIEVDPEKMGGTPVFRGTRVPVQTLLDYIEGGETVDEFLEDFPTVSRQHIVEYLETARDKMFAGAV